MKKSIKIISFVLFITFITITSIQGQTAKQVIIKFLNDKKYDGGKKIYTEAELDIPANIDKALEYIDISVYTLIRNEIYARKGYKFKNYKLNEIFEGTNWYKYNPNFDFSDLNDFELKNMNFIKAIENNYDYKVISQWLNNKEYMGDIELYTAPYYYEVKNKVQLALNHLNINPSRILRNEIFARKGYIFRNPKLKRIFEKTIWYKPVTNDIKTVSDLMEKVEFLNVELLRKREWLDILNTVNFTLPQNIESIPVIGYNTIFIKELAFMNIKMYYSSNFISELSKIDGNILNAHKTAVYSLVSKEIVDLIIKEPDPKKKLIIFFENKKYSGYADKIIFNQSDMQTPSYLKEAVEKYNVDYKALLRKEIHARNGAKFIDKKAGSIFEACSWYSGKYNLTTETPTRFPVNVKISETELTNFALIEGQYLHEIYNKHKTNNLVMDLSGNLYFVKIGDVYMSNSGVGVKLGYGFKTIEEYNSKDINEVINEMKEKYNFNPEEYEQYEEFYEAVGC